MKIIINFIYFIYSINLIQCNKFNNEINSKLILNDKTSLNINYYYHWEMFQSDIRKITSLELIDSFFGKLFNITIQRIVRLLF